MSTDNGFPLGTASAGTQAPTHYGWLVIDPAGYPYAWYGLALAPDAAAALALLEPDAALRERLLAAGWSTRAGSGIELVAGADVAKASA